MYQHPWIPLETRDWGEAFSLLPPASHVSMQDLLSARQLPMLIDRHPQDQPLTMYFEVGDGVLYLCYLV
jgi:hypothetical protein